MAVFVEIGSIPVHCNHLWSTREAALAAPTGDVQLGFCQACGMIYNLCFDATRMEYTPSYENSLHFSPCFQNYAHKLAARLVEKYHLYDRDIIEIGCGGGEFLSMLCAGGRNRGLGFDPSYDRRMENGESIKFVRDFYSETYSRHKADLICCRHVLEHIEHPGRFLLQLHVAIAERKDSAVFFEVPNFLYTLKELAVWDIIYEHCSYFLPPSLARIFHQSGFNVLHVYPAFGGQFLCLEAAPANGEARGERQATQHFSRLSGLIDGFRQKYRNIVEAWKERLERYWKTGIRVVVWSAGSKGVSFLNILDPGAQIEFVVDVNPRKQGRYIPGTGHQIRCPESLRECRPDVILVMNPIYKNEIQEMLDRMDVVAEVLTV
jgi:hypothetical protein